MEPLPQLTEAQLRALRRVAYADKDYRPRHDPIARDYLIELRDLGLIQATTTGTTGRKVVAATALGVALLRAVWLKEYTVRPADQRKPDAVIHPEKGVAKPPAGG